MQTPRIIATPYEHFSGIRMGVQFLGGKALVDDPRLAERLVVEYGYADVTPAPLPAKAG